MCLFFDSGLFEGGVDRFVDGDKGALLRFAMAGSQAPLLMFICRNLA